MINIFKAGKTEKAHVCQITSKSTETLCHSTSTTGKKFSSESNGTYKVGEWVIIVNGIIVAKTKKPKNTVHAYV